MQTSQVYSAVITSKGRLTIPAAIRRALGLKPHDKMVLRVVEGKIVIEPLPMTLEEAYGSVRPLQASEDFAALRAVVRDERVEKFAKKMHG